MLAQNTEQKGVQTATQTSERWHAMPPAEALNRLNADADAGLSDAEAAKRLEQYGANELIESGVKSPLRILWEQLVEPLVLILIFAAVVSAFLGKADSTIAIMAIVVLNALLGLFQEYRAEKAMAALKQMTAPIVRVRRNGQVTEVDAKQLVPGDIVMLEAGNIVPADARVVDASNLRVQEASLTGESYPVDKQPPPLKDEDIPLGDRRNMVYMGTSVDYGRGLAVITNTGMQTQLGRIADLIQTVGGDRTPLQKRMDEVGKTLFVVAFIVMGLAGLVGWITATPWSETLINAVAIAVAVVPEGLPAVVTISLALAAQRMLKREALIRKLPAVETLGSVTVICSDKTGTLTENRMTVTVVDVEGKRFDLADVSEPGKLKMGAYGQNEYNAQNLLMTAVALNNDSVLKSNGSDAPTVIGDPTEGAMAVAAGKFGLVRDNLEKSLPRVGEVPFSSERKRMTTVHDVSNTETFYNGYAPLRDFFNIGGRVAFSKGAVDSLLTISDKVWQGGSIVPLTDEIRANIEAENDALAGEGLRVLGVAFRQLDRDDTQRDSWVYAEEDMVFVGMLGMVDPPRPEVKDAVATARKAGIRPVMITGDHPLTATRIARELHIIDEDGKVLTGYQLANMSDKDIAASVEDTSVYARVSPEHKLQIVRALQDRGHIVAMTGDGVNDAPALKQADIGVAMGITGTDVSKEASDMVILDDNFATIVKAVNEGRTVYDNVRRFIKYLLASNTGELFVLLTTQLIAGMTMPLTTLQILWMNLITDGVPALALGVERAEKNAMDRKPYAPNASIFGGGLGRHILLIGGVLGVTSLALGWWAWSNGLEAMNGAPAWNTMVFLMLTLAQMGHAIGLRSHTESVFKMNPFSNRVLLGAVLVTVVLQLGAVYLPFFNNLFETNPLTIGQLAICLVLSTIIFWVVELEKLLMRRGILK